MPSDIKACCDWAYSDPLSKHYHDHEWGRPCFDERTLFEFLVLEGAQAGLSWTTVLKKRGHYRKVLENFEAEKIARFTSKKIEKLLLDPGIIRNRLKIESAISNAKAMLNIKEQSCFVEYLWQFVDGNPIINQWKKQSQIPSSTAISDKMSKQLKKDGFNFVGSTICYAFMQAVGMVNDHLVTCPCYECCL